MIGKILKIIITIFIILFTSLVILNALVHGFIDKEFKHICTNNQYENVTNFDIIDSVQPEYIIECDNKENITVMKVNNQTKVFYGLLKSNDYKYIVKNKR